MAFVGDVMGVSGAAVESDFLVQDESRTHSGQTDSQMESGVATVWQLAGLLSFY